MDCAAMIPTARPSSTNNGGNNGGGYRPDKGKMTGPRETIGSNTSSNSRKDQISPRSRGGMVQQDPEDGGTTYDPKKDKRGEMVGNDGSNNPKDTRGRINDNSKEATSGDGNKGTTRSSDNSNSERTGNNNNGTTTGTDGDNSGRKREIDRRTTVEERSYETPSRGNETPSNSGATPGTRGKNTETRENRTTPKSPRHRS